MHVSDTAAAGPGAELKRAGVLGVLPGIIGVMMATEAIKYIIGIGTPLIGRLVLYEALGMTYREMKINRDKKLSALRR